MAFAEICVNIPSRLRKTYSYSIPPGMELSVGDMVWVPFGRQTVQGIVFDINDVPEVEFTKNITGIIDPSLSLLPYQVDLARWISDYYLCSLFEAASLMLAPGAELGSSTWLVPALFPNDNPPVNLPLLQQLILDLVLERGMASLEEAKAFTGKKNLSAAISLLVKAGMVERVVSLTPPKVHPKTVPCLRLVRRMAEIDVRLGAKQTDVIAYLESQSFSDAYQESEGLIPQSTVLTATGASLQTIKSLTKRGIIEVVFREVLRDPLMRHNAGPAQTKLLTLSQERAWRRIRASLQKGPGTDHKPVLKPDPEKVFLLHGVTGSGKTEVYLKALEEVAARHRQGFMLVPEISLTPQTIERFHSHFPGRLAVLHSRLSIGEQFDEWRRIRRGDVDVIIGSRSALFAPAPDPGIIILDEEHEWTYKQTEKAPRYHTRDVALQLASLTGASVVLGSATPALETYFRAKEGDYTLLSLPDRVSPEPVETGDRGIIRVSPTTSELPKVELVDLRKELRAGNMSMFSRSLHEGITLALSLGEQVILFLNRRGTSSIIVCRECGYVVRCRRCDLPMTYHRAEEGLICHLCNRRAIAPDTCPKCLSKRIRYLGVGTQKVEEETAKVFPEARILRWDRDVTGAKHAHEEILRKFTNHEADILIGTQMVAKGLNLPLVTLVGVINADIGLHLPDFRSSERTFQVLTQVAGRAGRGKVEGRVIVQTYAPEHYAVKTASQHDFEAFYEIEVRFRRERSNPPYSRLARLIYSHSSDAAGQREAGRIASTLKKVISSRGIPDVSVLGPAPAFVSRLRGRYRWQVILRGYNLHGLLNELTLPIGWAIDVDPVSLL